MEKISFEKKRSRVKYCPCGKSNKDGKFAPYLGFEDKGYCHSCDKSFFPIEEIEESKEKGGQRPFSPPPPKPISYIEKNYLDASLKGYDQNNFVQFLINQFGQVKAMEAVKTYNIGTSKRWPGANIFWQIDQDNKIRSGKIMLYDTSTGKRQNKNSWVHAVLKIDDFNLNQCFFGSHIINSDPSKSIGIVESEKTAIIASILMPKLIWLASGGKAGLKASKAEFLKDRNIILFPDLTKPGDQINCFELWTQRAKELINEIPGIFIQVSDYLETRSTKEEKIQGLDIADYFLKWNWTNEENEENAPIQKPFISTEKSNFNEDDQTREIEKQISNISKKILQTIRDIKGQRAKESKLKNEIRNSEIPSEAIQSNKELLRKYRMETPPF